MSYFGDALDALSGHLGVTFPDLVLILIALSCLIIFGLSVRIGLMFTVVTLSVTFIVFTMFSLPTTNLLNVLMISFVMLTLSFFIKPNSGSGAF